MNPQIEERAPVDRVSVFQRPEVLLPLVFFAVIAIHGSLIGLTDDEAYYWVLAQKPSLGYAYHPPAVAWFIAAFQAVFGWLLGTHSVFLVRLPGIASVAAMLALSLSWLKECGVERARLWAAGGVLLSFAGIFALSWMMVPDLPLFLGFTITFVSVWRICFSDRAPYGWAALGAVLLLLSKYSGILSLGSAGLAVLFWAPASRRWKGVAALTLGGIIGVLPALLWNARHEWVSILYQIRERHEGASLSWVRYLRFWGAEAIAAGPVLIAFAFWACFRALRWEDGGEMGLGEGRMSRYLAVWILPPALIFCTQPLWADFKPHWAFIVWWPACLGLAWFALRSEGVLWDRLASVQRVFGFAVGILILVSCQVPIGDWVMKLRKPDFDPRMDVTNDLYGWGELRSYLQRELPASDQELPVVGSRYQTASQAAFALGEGRAFTMLPRDLKSRDEWPELGISTDTSAAWPSLRVPVIFIRDNRYDAPPEFPGAKCAPRARLEARRWNLAAKWIEAWRCEPGDGRP